MIRYSILLVTMLCFGCSTSSRDLDKDIPQATMVVGTEEQHSRVGTHCWDFPVFLFVSFGQCSDFDGIVIPMTPIVVTPGQTFRVTLPEKLGSAEVEYCWIPVTNGTQRILDESTVIWDWADSDCESLSRVETFAVQAPQQPGHHALTVFGVYFHPRRDAVHGFFVEVNAL